MTEAGHFFEAIKISCRSARYVAIKKYQHPATFWNFCVISIKLL